MNRGLLIVLSVAVALVAAYFLLRTQKPAPPTSATPKTDAAAAPPSPTPSPVPELPPDPTPPPSPAPAPPRERIEVRRPKPIPLNFDSDAFQRKPDGMIFKKYEIDTTSRLHQPSEDPVDDLQIISNVLDSYRTIFQENPIAGTNVEVTTALTGENEYDLVFIDPNHPAINEEGEIVDRWGTPFFFHAVSSKQPIDVYSAGPDKIRGTADDIAISEDGSPSLRGIDQSENE